MNYIKTTLNLILLTSLIIFVVALISPVKAVYITNIFIKYTYIVLTTGSNLIIQFSLYILEAYKKLVHNA